LSDKSSIDPGEVAKFDALAGSWWDPEGDFRPLHRLNPTRLAFIRDHACAQFARDTEALHPLAGLSVLDIGCGGGLLSEPLARLGGEVTGIDASQEAVEVGFDLVINMEVVEHVADVEGFMAASCALVKPGGAMAMATLNRTPKSFLMAVVGAEYVLGWLPRGTHDWRRFLRPSELVRRLEANALTVTEMCGVGYNPLDDRWRRSRDLDVNYMLFAARE
jgi:2-polyprenyl-6-hydroxyphenyl methylase/3-demethylubiquinone-9 3-methyltransferase